MLGCLLLHGLTSSLSCVDGLVPYLVERGIPYRLPVLRGHGGVPADLRGVTAADWHADAARALDDLLTECDRAVVVGLSMGGAVALHLAAERGDRLAGVVALAPALRLAGGLGDRLRVAALAATNGLVPVDVRNAYEDPERAAASTNYTHAPARAILALDAYGRRVARLLPRITIPLMVVYTPDDRVVPPGVAASVYERVATPPAQKRILAVPGSGHELLLDRKREAVCEAVAAFIDELRGAERGTGDGTGV
jgi:carboxylesterase